MVEGLSISLVGNRLALHFPYDYKIPGSDTPLRSDIKIRIPGARWNPTPLKAWTVPCTFDAMEVLEKIYGFELPADIIGRRTELEELLRRPNVLDPAPIDVRYCTDPMAHQKVAVNFSLNKRNAALLMEMGTGKTKVLVDWLYAMAAHGWCDRAVLLCPKALMRNEVAEFEKHGSWGSTVAYAIQGSGLLKAKTIKYHTDMVAQGGFRCLVVNYEALLADEVCDALLAFLKAGLGAAICDESTKIKNHAAERSKAACVLGKAARFRMIMTGSPIAERPTDIYGQYLFLEPRVFGESWAAFRAKFCLMGGWEGKEVIGYKEKDEFRRRLWSHAIRFIKAECLDLPPKVYERREFEMPMVMRSAHSSMAKEMFLEVSEKEFTAPIVLTKFLRLQEITSGYIKQGDVIEQLACSNPKLELLGDVLDESSDPKIVVWCREREEIRLVAAYLAKRGDCAVWELHGGTPDQHAAQQAFIDYKPEMFVSPDAGHRHRGVLICQEQTGGLGFTWTVATLAVYFSNSFSLMDRQQSEDRMHRKGQTGTCTYVDLVAKDSIDEYVIAKLVKKGTEAASVMELKQALEGWA